MTATVYTSNWKDLMGAGEGTEVTAAMAEMAEGEGLVHQPFCSADEARGMEATAVMREMAARLVMVEMAAMVGIFCS